MADRETTNAERELRRAFLDALKRGHDSVVRKFSSGSRATSVDAQQRTATFVISDSSVDRDSDTLDVNGWELDNYKRNPVLLYAHDYSSLPIGKCIKGPFLEDGVLKATFQFAKHQDAQDVFDLVADGTLNATSVGFKPKQFVENAERRGSWGFPGIDFKSQELLEVSVVPVPSNPNALLDGKSAGAKLSKLAKLAQARVGAKDTATGGGDEPQGGQPDATAKMDDCVKQLQDLAATHSKLLADQSKMMAAHASMMDGHAKAHGQILDAHKAASDANTQQATRLAELIDNIGDAMRDALGDPDEDEAAQGDDAGKGAAAAVAKGGAPHKLSKPNEKDARAALKCMKAIVARHEGEAATDEDDANKPGEGAPSTDESDEGDKSAKGAKAVRDFFSKLKGDPDAQQAFASWLDGRVGKALEKSSGKLEHWITG